MAFWILRLKSLFRSPFESKKVRAERRLAAETLEFGREKANKVIEFLHDELVRAVPENPELMSYLLRAMKSDAPDEVIIYESFDLQFLWGFFFEHVQRYDLRTNGFDRIKIHLIDWLVNYRDYKFEDAISEANSIEDQYNEDGFNFLYVSEGGKRAYTEVEPSFLVNHMIVKMESELGKPIIKS
jgi:hypothetical protein